METPNLAHDDFVKKQQLENARLNAPLNAGQAAKLSNATSDNYSRQADSADGHVDRLAQARHNHSKESNGISKQGMEDLKSIANPMGALSLVKYINLIGDMPFVAAIGAALLKDLLDFATAETVILSIIFSVLCSIFIFMMLLLVGTNKSKANSLLKMISVITAGGLADSIPGIDFLPIETLTVVATYVLTLIERRNAANPKQANIDEQAEIIEEEELSEAA